MAAAATLPGLATSASKPAALPASTATTTQAASRLDGCAGRPCGVRSSRSAGIRLLDAGQRRRSAQGRSPSCGSKPKLKPQRTPVRMSAGERVSSAMSGNAWGEDDDYLEARVDNVWLEPYNVIDLITIGDGGSKLRMAVGDLESRSLFNAIASPPQPMDRPRTYYLMTNMIEHMGCQITKVKVTHVVKSTFHARIFLRRESDGWESDMDARPSDAVILATILKKPIYISKMVLHLFGIKMQPEYHHSDQDDDAIAKELHEQARKHDPAGRLKARLVVATSEDRFSEAARLRQEIAMVEHQYTTLEKAMQKAIENERYEEAARLRDRIVHLDESCS
eukprot:jgi/Chlat1/1772/Chrsp134S02102